MNTMRVENWHGYKIRFVEQQGEWWAVLKDICDALQVHPDSVTHALDPSMFMRVQVEVFEPDPTWVLAVNEIGIYEIIFTSSEIEARQLRRWTTTVLQRLRGHVGLQPYEVMRMTEKEIQDDIDHFLDDLFYDQETGKWMMSVTVQGGDVEQVEFEDQHLFEG